MLTRTAAGQTNDAAGPDSAVENPYDSLLDHLGEPPAYNPNTETVMAKGNNSQGRDKKKAKTAPKKEAKSTPKPPPTPNKKQG